MQDTFARATHSAKGLKAEAAGRPSAARDGRVYCIQAEREQRYIACLTDDVSHY